MFLLLDTASNNVLAEFHDFAEAEQKRIQVVGMNPALAEYIEVVDLDRAVEANRRLEGGNLPEPGQAIAAFDAETQAV
jgi:anti-anti-sigma regulatory factor